VNSVVKLLCVLALFFSLNGHAALELSPYGAFGLGGGDFNQWSDSQPIDHDIYLVAPEIGARLGINIFGLLLGGVASIGRYHLESARTDDNPHSLDRDSYGNTVIQRLMGAYAGVEIAKKFKLWGEYYSEVRWDFDYAEPKISNPFRKDDLLEGDGYAVGGGIQLGRFGIAIIYRKVVFDLLTSNSQLQSFPNGYYSKYTTHMLMGQLSFAIELL
jgi:hypothetical protein